MELVVEIFLLCILSPNLSPIKAREGCYYSALLCTCTCCYWPSEDLKAKKENPVLLIVRKSLSLYKSKDSAAVNLCSRMMYLYCSCSKREYVNESLAVHSPRASLLWLPHWPLCGQWQHDFPQNPYKEGDSLQMALSKYLRAFLLLSHFINVFHIIWAEKSAGPTSRPLPIHYWFNSCEWWWQASSFPAGQQGLLLAPFGCHWATLFPPLRSCNTLRVTSSSLRAILLTCTMDVHAKPQFKLRAGRCVHHMHSQNDPCTDAVLLSAL